MIEQYRESQRIVKIFSKDDIQGRFSNEEYSNEGGLVQRELVTILENRELMEVSYSYTETKGIKLTEDFALEDGTIIKKGTLVDKKAVNSEMVGKGEYVRATRDMNGYLEKGEGNVWKGKFWESDRTYSFTVEMLNSDSIRFMFGDKDIELYRVIA